MPRLDTPVAEVTTPELANRLCERAAHISAATYQLLVDLREFDRRDGWGGEGVKSLAHWLNWKCGYDLRTARDMVRVARALEHLPLISAAFSKGLLGYSKVRAITRIATSESEEELLGFADSGTTAHVERLVSYYRKWAPTDPDDAAAAFAKRNVAYHYDDDGSVVVTMRLPGDEGAVWIKAVEMMEDELNAGRTTENGSREPRPDRADAVVEIARRQLAGDREGAPAGERYQVVVHVDAETLSGGKGIGYLDEGGSLPSETIKRILCDTAFVMVVKDKDGKVLKISERKRTISPALRRSLRVMYKHCQFPGCANTRFLDAHHILHFIGDNGETELENLVLLCPFHHRLHHEGLYRLNVRKDGKFTFLHRGGWEIETAALTVEPGGVERENAALQIDLDTIAAKWGGESCDYGAAVSYLSKANGCENGSREPRAVERPRPSAFATRPVMPAGFDSWSIEDKIMWEVRMQQTDEPTRVAY